MKALLLSPTAQMSGAEAVLLRAAHAMRDRGWNVRLGAPANGPLLGRAERSGLAIAELPDLKLPGGSRTVAAGRMAVRTVKAAVRLRRLAREVDVVLVNGFFALPALRLAFPNTPVAWLVHDVVHRQSWMRVLRATAPVVDLAVAVSGPVAVPLRAAGLAVTVVPNGTRWPVAPMRRAPGPPVVGCAAMLTSWKGQDILLDAVAELGKSVVVELAGGQFPKDGPYVERLRQRAARPDLQGRVRFLGNVADASERMRTWTVAALPSVDPEASPLAVLEAMSIGLPVVATAHGGPTEMIGEAGLLVPPRDPAALANAIRSLLEDDRLWERCHQAGPVLIERSHALDRQLARLVEVLAGLARGDLR
jgi:glycosyltransferase involved in cell wall biosynthesis